MPALRYWDGATYRLLGAGGPTGPTGPAAPVATAAHQRWYRNAVLSMASGAWTVVGFDTQLDNQDPAGAITWDSTNNVFRVNQAGVYLITATVGGALSLNGTGRRSLSILKNGVYQAYSGGAAATVLLPGLAVSSAFLAALGDTFQVQAYQDSGSTANTSNAANTSFYASVSQMTGTQGLPGPTGPAGPAGGGSTIVSVRATQTAAMNLTTTPAIIPFNSEQWDTQNAYNTTTGQFTCPVAGKYRISAQACGSSTSASQWVGVQVLKNGVQQGSQSVWNPSTGNTQAQVVDTLDCAIGDVISFTGSASQTMAVYVTGITYMTIDLLSGTGPQGPPGPTGPPAGYMSLVYYQTIPRPTVASSPYTLTHNLGTPFLLVNVWDSVTHQLVSVQVQIFDNNHLGITVAQDMPNPVNVVVMGTALTPTPIAAGDLATKAYVDAKTTTLPGPVTSGSGIQSFTDVLGDVWVAANGVRGGNWYRARDVLHCRVYRNAAYTLSTSNVVVPWDSIAFDPYGMFTGGPNYRIVAPIAGIYLLRAQMQATPTATGQWINIIMYSAVTGTVNSGNAVTASATFGPFLQTVSTHLLAAGEGIFTYAAAIGALTVTVGQNASNFSIDYLGTG